jgi:hypothetical protein
MGAKELVMAMKFDAEQVVAKHDAVLSALEVDLKQAEDKGFDLGLAQAGVPAGDKIYTEADLQAEIVKAKELAASEAMVAAEVVKQEALAKLKAEMVADFEAAQVDDSAFLAKWKA